MDSDDESADQFSTGSNGSSSTSHAAKTNHLDMQLDREKRKRKPNVHRDRSSVIAFIHSWSDEMFKQQFRLTRQDFVLLESIILENMARKGAIWKSTMLLLLEAVVHQFHLS